MTAQLDRPATPASAHHPMVNVEQWLDDDDLPRYTGVKPPRPDRPRPSVAADALADRYRAAALIQDGD